jgi:hypothetical protein
MFAAWSQFKHGVSYVAFRRDELTSIDHRAGHAQCDAPIPEVDKAKIFHRNAERVFGIPPGA